MKSQAIPPFVPFLPAAVATPASGLILRNSFSPAGAQRSPKIQWSARQRAGRHLAVVFAMLVSSSLLAYGQVTSATLSGTVTDSTEAAIAGAQVQVQNLDTGLRQTVLTNDSGIYSASQLPPGKYTATVDKDGFRKSIQTEIVLTVSQTATLNISLAVGSVQEVVTVTADEDLINTTAADLSSVVNSQSVAELPLNGRDPTALALLSTGTSNAYKSGFAQSTSQGTNSLPGLETAISSGGGRQGSTYVLLDGAPNMDNYLETALPAPNADATQEFRVLTQSFDAQYGFSQGAVIAIQTKSGTNAFHGGAFEFIRNNDLNAADYFTKTKDLLKRNQFGGELGGPVLKDTLFFFASYQDTRTAATVNTGITYAPTQAMLNGDFTAVSQTLPAPFVNNKINPTLFDQTMLNLVKIALPIGQDSITGRVGYTLPPQATNYYENTDRLDYTINSSQRLFLRSYILYFNENGGDVKGNILAVNEGQTGHDYNEALGHSWIVNNTTVNNLTLSYLQEDTLAQQLAQTSDGKSFCWSKYIAITEPGGQCYLEGFYYANAGSNWTEPIAQRRSTWALSDTLSKTIENLTVSTGLDLHKQFSQEATEYPSAPIVVFGTGFTGNGMADLLLGDLNNFQQGGGEVIPLKGWQLGAYLQGKYRIKPNLTITAGMRWDPNTPPASVGGRGVVFEPGASSIVYPNAPMGLLFPGDPGITSGLMPTDYNIFEPRLGVAWQPTRLHGTVIRAGLGVFSGPILYNYYNHFVDISPFSPYYTVASQFNPNGSVKSAVKIDAPWASAPSTGSPGYNPFTAPYGGFASVTSRPPSNSTFGLPVDVGGAFAPDFQAARTTSWSFSIEQQITRDLALHIAYVGSHTDHAMVLVDENAGDTNPADATFGQRVTFSTGAYSKNGVGDYSQIYVDQSIGTSPYNSLQIGLEKRLSRGIQFQSNFTWEKVEDDTGIGSVPIPNPTNVAANKAISTLNLPLSSMTNFVYTSPALNNWNFVARALLGTWQLSSIYTLQSGQPFSINGDANGINSGTGLGGETAYKVPGASFHVHSGSKAHWLQQYVNLAAFTSNPAGTFGDSRNIFHTVHLNYADAALSKNWKVQERYGMQLRFDMFNAFNHPSFGIPDNNIGDGGQWVSRVWTPNPSGNFGHIANSGNEPARVMQGAIKISF